MPYAAYLVYGYVLNSKNEVVSNASLEVVTSVGRRYYTSESSGIYLFDLAEAGYVDGEEVTINIKEPFNNEFKSHKFNVSGAFHNEDIPLSERTEPVNATDYSPRTILHTVGKKPVSKQNPLPVSNESAVLEGYYNSGEDPNGQTFGFMNKKGA